MTPAIPNDLIKINDPEIDVDEIMAAIQERIEQRRAEMGYENKTFPSFGLAEIPDEPEDFPADSNLYHHLRLANKTFANVQTESILVSSPMTDLPIVGRAWKMIREQAHNLVLFYVNRFVTHQTGTNRHLISALNRLTATVQEQQRAIIALEHEVAILKRRGED